MRRLQRPKRLNLQKRDSECGQESKLTKPGQPERRILISNSGTQSRERSCSEEILLRPVCHSKSSIGKQINGQRVCFLRPETSHRGRMCRLSATECLSLAGKPFELPHEGRLTYTDTFALCPQVLDGISPDEFLLKPIMACALGAMANRENDARGKEIARRYYIDALTATNAALRHPRKVKEDNTIVAVSLLSVFEVCLAIPHLRLSLTRI